MNQGGKVQVPWSDIDTLLLDMDGTLLDLAFDNFFWLELVPEIYASARGCSIAEAREELFARYGAIAGTLPWYCVEHWSAELGIDIEHLKRRHSHRIRYLPGARAFLRLARQLRKRLILVTNAHQITLTIKCEQTGIDALLDVLVSSHEYGVEKERAGFWHRLEVEQGIRPERALILDDNLTVLQTAVDCGVGHAIAIRCPDTTREPRAVEEFAAVDGVSSLLD